MVGLVNGGGRILLAARAATIGHPTKEFLAISVRNPFLFVQDSWILTSFFFLHYRLVSEIKYFFT